MLPTLAPGDRVITFNWGGIKKSDVVVFMNEGKYCVKRVVSIEKDQVSIAGDNKLKSKPMGPINKKSLIGKIIWKYR